MTAATQELFEKFYEAHGKPNDEEKGLLERVGYVNGDVMDQWCKQRRTSSKTMITDEFLVAAKEFRLRAITVMERTILRSLMNSPGYITAIKARELQRLKPKKSIHCH